MDVETAGPPRKDSLAPLLKALGMARRAEPTRLAGERQQVFRMAVRANAVAVLEVDKRAAPF